MLLTWLPQTEIKSTTASSSVSVTSAEPMILSTSLRFVSMICASRSSIVLTPWRNQTVGGILLANASDSIFSLLFVSAGEEPLQEEQVASSV